MDDKLVAYACTTAHQLDFGGRVPGSNACDSTEIYQEGLRIPPLKYYERGVRSHSIYRIIQKNVRISGMVLGDIEAQVAATGIGERGLIDLAQKYGGWSVLRQYLDELMDYSERMTRAAIRALHSGTYEFEDFLDDDGFVLEPVRIHVKVIVDGDNITFDFTGTSPTVKGSINLPLSSSIALVNVAVRLFLDVTVPSNAGVHRPVKIITPYDTLMNLGFPAGCGGRGATMGRVWDALVGALAKIAPDKIPAANAEVDFGICLGGRNEEGKPFVFTEFLIGSWGGRPWADGIDVASPPWLNYSNIPCEVIEKEYPVRMEKYTFVPDTGGAGKYRGGLGVIREYHILANDVVCQWRQDRALFPPWGLQGGKPGGYTKGYHISNGQKRELRKSVFFCKEGDVLQAILPGGGGYGNPLERDVGKVADDVRNEKISLDTARSEYGVVIDQKTMQVDMEATKNLRQTMRTASKPRTASKK
jgi:N-methylhydantoinase B